MATFTTLQQVYALNLLAGSASLRVGTVQQLEAFAAAKIKAVFADSAVQALIGTWETVWGPIVYQHNPNQPSVADNTMYVAQRTDTSTPEYVIGVAGTNPDSWFGWLIEDFTLVPMVSWPYAKLPSPVPQITQGTNTGINILFGMVSKGQTLVDFLGSLTSAASANFPLWVTGHSLGGALSPTLALALADQQGQAGKWDPSSLAQISVLPTAGPTPGDFNFSNYYDLRLGSSTSRFWNGLDVVPHAWELSMVAQIPSLYAPNIEPNTAIDAVAAIAAAKSADATLKGGSPLTQLLPQTKPLPGTFDPDANLPNTLTAIEIALVNRVIAAVGAKIGLNATEIAIIKTVVDELIKIHNGSSASTDKASLSSLSAQTAESAKVKPAPLQGQSLFDWVTAFLDFLIQAGYQHTKAYPILMDVQAFVDLNNKIQVPS